MTKDILTGEGISPDRALEIANNHFERALDALDESLNVEKTARVLDGSATARASVELRKAAQILFEERKKVEQYRNKTSGVAYNFAIDLDKARDEIWRRLSCLRDPQAAGDVSGEP